MISLAKQKSFVTDLEKPAAERDIWIFNCNFSKILLTTGNSHVTSIEGGCFGCTLK